MWRCALLLVAGCQQGTPAAAFSADDCPMFLLKAHDTIAALGAHAHLPYTRAMEAEAERDCRTDAAAGKPMLLARCVLAAKNDAEVRACFPTIDQLKDGPASN